MVIVPALLAGSALLLSCSGEKDNAKTAEASSASMNALYAAQGTPVSTRTLSGEDFSVYLKYPSVLEASSQASAYAGLSEVVRAINAKVGDKVRRDQVIVGFSADNAQLAQAKVAYNAAETEFRRLASLYKTHDISEQQYQQVKSQYEQAGAALKAAQDMIQVKAPIDGYITQINVRLTQNVQAGTPLFTITNEGGFETKFYVDPSEISKIRMGERVYINKIPARGTPALLEGRVTQVSYSMDQQRQAFPITASFAASLERMDRETAQSFLEEGYFPGKWVDVVVEVYNKPDALVLSRTELIENDDGTWAVYRAVDGKARLTAVRLGQTEGLTMEIASGLSAGDVLVSEGATIVRDGDKLNVVQPLLARHALALAQD
jgi:RND family efflux transporter MFP subunit